MPLALGKLWRLDFTNLPSSSVCFCTLKAVHRGGILQIPAQLMLVLASPQGQLARLTEFIGSDAEFWQSGLVARLQSGHLDGLQPSGACLR